MKTKLTLIGTMAVTMRGERPASRADAANF